MSRSPSGLTLCGDAALEAFADQVAWQIAADKNDAAVAFLVGLPRPLVVAVQNHVYALKNEALLVVLEGEDAFAAQNVRAFLLHQVLYPGKEFVWIERLFRAQCYRLHVLVVIVLESAMRIRANIVMAPMIMIVIVIVMMIVILGAEEVGF